MSPMSPTGSLLSYPEKRKTCTAECSNLSFIEFQFPSWSEPSLARFDRSLGLSVAGAGNTLLHQFPPHLMLPR